MRAPFQVLVIPFRLVDDKAEYCVFKRSDNNLWQFISGGGEDLESKEEAAIREIYEETGIFITESLIKLNTVSSIPSYYFTEILDNYPELLVVPEYCFSVNVSEKINLSSEHKDYIWVDYQTANKMLEFDSNKTALYELMMILKKTFDIK